MIKKFVENIKRPLYWIPKVLLIVFCVLHEQTKYQTARNIEELFYWPEGPCMDMIVLALFGAVGIWSLWKEFYLIRIVGTSVRDE